MIVADLSNVKPADATERAWKTVLAAAVVSRATQKPIHGQAYSLSSGRLIHCRDAGADVRGDDHAHTPAEDAAALIVWDATAGWRRAAASPAAAAALLDLYLPICSASRNTPITVGHLGQSLDGNVATGSGDSYFVTGPANLLHLHRMRALCDAVVVGAGTVTADDPQLTTRRAAGDHPVRVILDPQRRLSPEHGVFHDGEAPTLLVCDAARLAPGERVGSAELLGIRAVGGQFDLAELIDALHARDLYAIFVEGGGRTVSAFLEAGLLDRLQIAVAPLITGAGRPGLSLAARDRIKDCLRPVHRLFAMGEDVLFDCDLRAGTGSARQRPPPDDLSRIL